MEIKIFILELFNLLDFSLNYVIFIKSIHYPFINKLNLILKKSKSFKIIIYFNSYLFTLYILFIITFTFFLTKIKILF